jgi:hypothetical protein
MSNFVMPRYLYEKKLPTHKENVLSRLKDKYAWETYGDITIDELKKLHMQDIAVFWKVIKYLSFQGCEFTGKLLQFSFSNQNGKGYTIVFDGKQDNIPLDFDYTYAFLKIQLQPYGIFEKYDLHLVPLHHIINDHMKVEKVKDFFQNEGFAVRKTETIKSDVDFSIPLKHKGILKSTEKELFFSVEDKTYTVSVDKRDLSLRDGGLPASKILKLLIDHGYEEIGDLPSDMSFLLQVPHVAHRTVEKFFLAIDSGSSKELGTITQKRAQHVVNIAAKNSFMYYGEQIPLTETLMRTSLESECFGSNVFQLFIDNDFETIGELPFDLETYLKEHGYKKVESRDLGAKVYDHLPIDYLKELFFRSLQQFSRNEKPPFLQDRDWEIVLLRLEGNTLEEVGERFGVTRERARQIIRNSLDKMFNRYKKLFSYIKKEIYHYPFINVYDLFNDQDKNLVKLATSFMHVYTLPFNIYGDYYVSLDERDQFYAKLKAFKSNIANQYDETHVYSRDEIELYVLNYFSAKRLKDFETIMNDLIRESFEAANEANYYTFKQKISKTRMCQIVFEEEFADGLNVYKEKEVYIEKLLEYFPQDFKNDTARSIIANLTRDDSVILLWRVGYFKHISVVHPDVSVETLAPIKDWLQSQLSDEIRQINTNVAFGEFAAELERLEIDTEHALFSLLKIYYPEAFNYSRSPALVMVGHERMEKKKIIESYVKDYDGYVTNDELINHFMKTLGWTKTMYEQNTAASEYLLKTSDGLVHIDYLDLEKEDLDGIFLYAKQKTNRLQNSYSVEIIFEERKSTLLQMNVKDGRVLYHLLEKYYPEEFDFFRYPYVHPVGKYKTDQLSAVAQFETFFLENEDYFLREELYEEFVQERGWNMSTYYMAYSKNKEVILQVFPDEFAHVQLIEWNKEKEQQLIELLEAFLNENKDKPFIHIERDIISNDSLVAQFPDINPLFNWNHQLLVSVLEKSNAFVLLGTIKAGILSKDNAFGIKSEHDFLTYLLKNKFNGYVKVAELQKYLFSIDMCGNSKIPRYYLRSADKELDFELVNDEVILKELLVR